MKKISKIVIQFLIGAAAGGGGMALYFYLRDLLQIQSVSWPEVIIILIAAIFIVVLVHEIGHFIAGKMVGFSFYMLTVGPFKIQKIGDKIRPGINKHLNTGGGLTLMVPRQSSPENSKMYWYIAGGPVASFTLGITTMLILLWFAGSTESPGFDVALYALYTTGFVSFVIGFTSIIPTGSEVFESDGNQILDLYRGGEKATIKQQTMSLSVTIWNGTRPRDIDKNLLDSVLLKAASKTSTQALNARLIAVYYHLDSKKIDEAEVILNSLIKDLEKNSNTLLEGTVFIEKAFISAAYRRDSKTAKTFFEKGKKGFVEYQTIARAESALLIINGEIERGMARAKQGLKVADHSMDKGGIIYEKEILKQLAKGDLPGQVVAN
ncbi:hypothetical protein DYD21_00365 [Rhodohalobacter sp. SW132]|uniref:M50 family metallopeptidase n=1 Tax=Rhodohalobacter sp. SW132 TaxID=2293433 RepID=UPI000E25C190|nr:M50 family metallopeptidase [Rhodohalobacter sp. SW132]REL38441.1 hypothetical protein DYD21_00365 [Rhodohalobacter sp. SW132]